MLVAYALEHVRLQISNRVIFDIRFWDGTNEPSRENARKLLPQLANLTSGLN